MSSANKATDFHFPKHVFAVTQCAEYTTQQFITTVSREHGISTRQVEDEYIARFGGVDAFLQYARKQKAHNLRVRNDPNTFLLGEGPQDGQRVEYAHLVSWGFYLRLYGFEHFGPRGFLSFDFVDGNRMYMKAPNGLAITVVSSVAPPARLYSVQESMRLSAPGNIANALRNASEEDIGKEGYMVMQGVLLTLTFNGETYRVRVPEVPAPVSHFLNLVPLSTF